MTSPLDRWRATRERLRAFVTALGQAAPSLWLGDALELVDYNELGIALENVCSYLSDQADGVCPAALYPELRALVDELRIDRRWWGPLRPG